MIDRVTARDLPSGDMAVWHPISEQLRAIIEPICRNGGRGTWNVQHNNWVIRKQFATAVLADLASRGVQVSRLRRSGQLLG